MLAQELRLLLAERGNIRTRKARKAWRAQLDEVTEGFRGDTAMANGEKVESSPPLRWTAVDAATMTATGPSRERVEVSGPDGDNLWHWNVEAGSDGRQVAHGKKGSRDAAKRDVTAFLYARRKRLVS